MTGEDYLVYDWTYRDCMLRITDDLSLKQTWLLGVPFLQTYYSIHDLDNHRFGLVKINKKVDGPPVFNDNLMIRGFVNKVE